NRPAAYWKQAPDIVARPEGEFEMPASVHWDEFIGPAPMRPYAYREEMTTDRRTGEKKTTRKGAYHPFAWRGWWDFGTGALGDMACHTANMPFMALKLQYPTSISAESGPINPETYPAWATVTWEFPARGDMPPVKLVWYEGHRDGARNLPAPELLKGRKASDSGALLVGTKGTLFSPNDYAAALELLPKENF